MNAIMQKKTAMQINDLGAQRHFGATDWMSLECASRTWWVMTTMSIQDG
jgi:hypothetical protein